MKTFDVKYFVEHIDEILAMVKQGETIELLRDGKVVARVVPVEDGQRDKEEVEAFLKTMREIAAKIGAEAHETVDVTRIISEGRRKLPISDHNSDAWKNLERLSVEIGKHWTDDVDAVAAVRDIRREL